MQKPDLYGVRMKRNGRFYLRECVYRLRSEANQAAHNIAINNDTETRVHVFKPSSKQYLEAVRIVTENERERGKESNFTISIDSDGKATVVLSDYAAWAVLRRLQHDEPADKTEAEFVDAFAEELSTGLCAVV